VRRRGARGEGGREEGIGERVGGGVCWVGGGYTLGEEGKGGGECISTHPEPSCVTVHF